MNVVIYARYSSHNQTEQSIEGQLKFCYDYAKRNNLVIVGEYVDRALTGTNDKRPEFMRMIGDAKRELFQGVLVYQLDRFARNRYDSAIYKKEIKKHNVRVLSARENITEDASGILIEGLLESLAEYFSVELSQKIHRGMDLNAEKCLSTGGNIALGFIVDKDKHFQIDPATAPIVQSIFESYANGETVTEIITQLNAQGLKTSRGTAFNKNSLHTMLQNKRYIGVYTYKGTETPNGLPRIISDELFNKVAVIMEKNRKAPARSKAKVEYLLTTKLFCGYCKEMMTGFSGTGKQGKVYRYYICNGAKQKKCHKKNVNKEYIESLVVSECRKLLTTANIDKIAEEVTAICETEKDTSNLKYLKKQLAENERKHNNAVNAVMECDIDSVRKTFYAQIATLEEQHKEIEKQIAIEETTLPSMTVPKIKFFLSSLKKGNINDVKYRRALINIFVNQIYLFDDKITLIFNSGDMPVTINDVLLSEIQENMEKAEGLFLDGVGPPNIKYPPILGGYFFAYTNFTRYYLCFE